MSTEKVICRFKNLTIHPNGSKILARNLNKLLHTTSFDELQDPGSLNDTHEVTCSPAEADYIRSHLADLLTSDYRSIWFTYPNASGSQPMNGSQQGSWTVIYRLGAMLNYDTFIDYSGGNRYSAWIRIEKDVRGRPATIVLETKQTNARFRFDLQNVQKNVLVKYRAEQSKGDMEVIFMLKGLPQLYERMADGSYVR